MKTDNTSIKATLGIFVGSSTIEGVLVSASDGPATLLHRVSRARPRRGDLSGSGDLSQSVPGLKSSDDIDFTLEIGQGQGETSSPLGDDLDSSNDSNGQAQDPSRAPFHGVLNEILSECAVKGYKNPDIAFCVTPPDVSYRVVTVPLNESERSEEAPNTIGQKRLSKHLGEIPGHIDRRRIAFYPLDSKEHEARYLAVLPASDDSVSATIKQIEDRGDSKAAPLLIDSETTVLAEMARGASYQNEHEAVVRVGVEDTLILFFKNGRLAHHDRLRSLTAYDVPDTICSRVMLQQDEHKINSLETIYLIGGGIEERLVQSFRSFYSDAAILPLRDAISPDVWDADSWPEDGSASTLPALGVALRLLADEESSGQVNLLGKTSWAQRRRFPVAWHSVAATIVLIVTAGLFGMLYSEGQAEILQEREQLESDPSYELAANPDRLQSQIDSLQQAHREHTHALQVLDSLLVGSDKWSRTMEKTSVATGSVPQVWFRSWQSRGNSSIQIDGNALRRSNVALLARQLNGSIERLEYSETNDVRTYPFTIVAPVVAEMPEVAEYLQRAALDETAQDTVDDDASSYIRSTGHN